MSPALFDGFQKPNRFLILTGILLILLACAMPCASAAIQLVEGENDFGLISYKEAPKTWTVSLDDFEKVEVGVYTSARAEPARYGGWRGSLKVNGKKIWEHTGDSNIKDYLMGQTVKETAYRNQYYDLTSQFHKGENTVTYYHYTGDGNHGLKIRLTKGMPATTAPTPAPTTVPTTTPPATEATPTNVKPYCAGSVCGVISSLKLDGVEVEGQPSPEVQDIVDRVNTYLWKVNPIYGGRGKDATFTLSIVSTKSSPFWNEARNEMQVPLDAKDTEIAHEIGHYMTYGIIMANNGKWNYVPLWFREGVAEHISILAVGFGESYSERFVASLMAKPSRADINADAKKALDSAKKVSGTSGMNNEEKTNFYGSSATFVQFLYDTYGKDDIIITLVDSSEDSVWRDDIDTILERRTGKSFDELEDDWLAYLDEEEDIYVDVDAMTPAPTIKPLSESARESLQKIPVVGGGLGSAVSGFLQIFGW